MVGNLISQMLSVMLSIMLSVMLSIIGLLKGHCYVCAVRKEVATLVKTVVEINSLELAVKLDLFLLQICVLTWIIMLIDLHHCARQYAYNGKYTL